MFTSGDWTTVGESVCEKLYGLSSFLELDWLPSNSKKIENISKTD